jgi:hypothetical protein
LDFRAFAYDDNQKARRHGVKRSAVADLFGLQFSTNNRDDVVGGHLLGFVDEENPIQ